MGELERGRAFDLKTILPVRKNFTLSKSLVRKDKYRVLLFSLAEGSSISEEFYEAISIFIGLSGQIEVMGEKIGENDFFMTFEKASRSVLVDEDSQYLEIIFNPEEVINMDHLEKGRVINLKDEIDYVEGGISNLDLVNREDISLVLMAFDKGEGLNPHAAPGDAMIIALEGSAELMVGEEFFTIKEGQQVIFPKDINHNVTAKDERFKMLLIMVRDK